MFGLRLTIDVHARSKNGQPAQNTTGVASARPSQLIAAPRAIVSRPPAAMSAIATTTIGAASAAAIRKRRVMSTSSGFGPSSSVAVIGSSAIPQIGHAPGPSCTICGSIGQV